MITISTFAVLGFLVMSAAPSFGQQPPTPRKAPTPRQAPSSRQASTPQQTQAPPPMTAEKAFYYSLAMWETPENSKDVIDRYASYFDAANYTRAMADEFQRARYRQGISARIAYELKNLNFGEKFSFVGSTAHEGYTMLGEYSFESHSFPILNVPSTSFCIDAQRSTFGNCLGTVVGVNVFRLEGVVNRTDFKWSLAMSETEASAFIKSRAMAGSGGVDRKIALRITYSLVNLRRRGGSFSPFVHSVEVFTDERLTRKLGVVAGQPGTPESAFAPETARAAQTPSKIIGEYR
jgi:hypothetical protein